MEDKLKNNRNKLEDLLVGTRQQSTNLNIDSIIVEDVQVKIILDQELNMAPQVNSICKASFLQLRDIRAITKYLNDEATQMATHPFVSSRLDYGNALLYGVQK